MDIAIHLGAHCTDEDLILKTLAGNGELLTRHAIHLPPNGKARPALRKALQDDKGLLPDVPNPLVADLMEKVEADRMVLSYEAFLATYATALSGPHLYPEAGHRCARLRDIFGGHDVHFYLALRNPATFVPALFEASSIDDFGTFLSGHDLGRMTWSEPVAAIRAACPDVPLTIWCNEDLPLIWPNILRAVAGVDAPMNGQHAILRQIMTADGFRRLEAYLKDNPVPNLQTWRRVVTAFLGKYADESKVEPEIDLPGWSEEMIAGLSDLYEKDVARLKAMEDLTFIAP